MTRWLQVAQHPIKTEPFWCFNANPAGPLIITRVITALVTNPSPTPQDLPNHNHFSVLLFVHTAASVPVAGMHRDEEVEGDSHRVPSQQALAAQADAAAAAAARRWMRSSLAPRQITIVRVNNYCVNDTAKFKWQLSLVQRYRSESACISS
jgi:hypothetical protein